MSNTLHLPCRTEEVSDGDHTFGELYAHRDLLMLALMASRPRYSWIARKHNDGTSMDGYFIAGTDLSGKMITYHIPNRFWITATQAGVRILETAPPWDGHTSTQVLTRLANYIQTPEKPL